MPNEIKTISPEEEKTPSHLPVLTVDKDDVLPTEKQDQEAAWTRRRKNSISFACSDR